MLGIQQLDRNIRLLRLLATEEPAGAAPAADKLHDLDRLAHLMCSSDCHQFVASLKGLSEAVESIRHQLRHAEQQLVLTEKMG